MPEMYSYTIKHMLAKPYVEVVKYLALLNAEKKCGRPHAADWHPQLHRSYLIY
jgi:hypothetical protein